MNDAIEVLTTTGDHQTAETLARDLVERRLAACVQIGGPLNSVYRWQGEIHREPEILLLVKTAARLYPQVQAIEARLKDAIRAKQIARMPQNLTRLDAWAADALAKGLISTEEQALLAKFAELGDMAVQVDDFPSDFGLAENLQKFQQGAQTPATREAAE